MTTNQKIYHYQKNQAIFDLIPTGIKKILDIGCGDGAISDFIDSNTIIHGITISESEYELASKKLDKVFLFNLEKGLPKEIDTDYDLVIASHVLEHIAYPSKLLSDIKNALNKRGCLIVALPNIMHYKYRTKLILGKFDYEDAGVMDKTHLRWYTFNSAKNMLIDNGFDILKSGVSGELPFYRVSKFLPKPMYKLLQWILFKFSKGFFGLQLFYLVNAKSDKK